MMELEDWQIETNEMILTANLRQIDRYASVHKSYGAKTLTGMVRPWNPGYFVGTKIEVKACAVPDSLEQLADGRYIFSIAGDDRIDFNPTTGRVTMRPVMVVFDPSQLSRNFDAGRPLAEKKFKTMVNSKSILDIHGVYSAGFAKNSLGEATTVGALLFFSMGDAVRPMCVYAEEVGQDQHMTDELARCKPAKYTDK